MREAVQRECAMHGMYLDKSIFENAFLVACAGNSTQALRATPVENIFEHVYVQDTNK